MDQVIIYARRLQAGELPPSDLPGNMVPLYVDDEGKLLVSVEGVTVDLPGGGVNILAPLGASGAVQVETVPGVPLEVGFPVTPDVNVASPVGLAGGVQVEPAPTAVFPVAFDGPQQVVFPATQSVEFAAPQQVVFPATQSVAFPAAQPVNIASPVGAGGGIRIENNPGQVLPVGFAGAIPEVTLAVGLTDPFSRMRVSEALTLFDSKFIWDKKSEVWGEILAGAATSVFTANTSEIRLTVGTASGDRAVRQSYSYVPYQPGKGRLVFLTGVISNEPKANCTSRLGLFDSTVDKTGGNDTGGDGTFFEMQGTTMYCVVRSFVGGVQTEERFAQSAWNVDKMDGTGPSGITIDWTKSQIFVIDLEWLGVGTVTFSLFLNRKLYILHQAHHANSLAGVYMRRASLPVRYEIENTGVTAGSTYLRQICCTVISEGGYHPAGDTHSANFGITVKAVNTAEIPLCAVRVRPSFNRATLQMQDMQIELDTSDVVLIRVYSGPITLTGAAWSDVDAAASVAQFDRAATAFAGTAILRYSGYVTVNSRKLTLPSGEGKIPLVPITDIQGVPYPLLITAQNQSGPASLLAAVSWSEP